MKNIKEGSEEFSKFSHLFVSKEKREKRLDLCNSCDMMIAHMKAKFCQECGCLIGPKPAMNTQTCPLGKW